ncbi:preprotein translocase subunit SecE [Streptomyces griseoincarnatus]
MTDAVGSIDMPDAQEQKPRKGGKRAKKGPLKRLTLFYRQIIAELRKVVWPTRNQLTSYTIAVIIFVVVMIGLITLIDYGLSNAAKYVFG